MPSWVAHAGAAIHPALIPWSSHSSKVMGKMVAGSPPATISKWWPGDGTSHRRKERAMDKALCRHELAARCLWLPGWSRYVRLWSGGEASRQRCSPLTLGLYGQPSYRHRMRSLWLPASGPVAATHRHSVSVPDLCLSAVVALLDCLPGQRPGSGRHWRACLRAGVRLGVAPVEPIPTCLTLS